MHMNGARSHVDLASSWSNLSSILQIPQYPRNTGKLSLLTSAVKDFVPKIK